jgi:hypothetical protein
MKPQKIRITPDMIINDMGIERVENLFCEFDNDGDPLYGVEGQIPQIHHRSAQPVPHRLAQPHSHTLHGRRHRQLW